MELKQKYIEELRNISSEIDIDFAMREIAAITDIEYPQTFTARLNSANYVTELLRKEGFSGVLQVDFPADGKTTYQDKRMPMSWDVSHARLTLLSKVAGLDDQVIADYEKMPFSVVWGSVSTPEGGIKVRIINESDVFMGEDARGALVLLDAKTKPNYSVLPTLLDLGAIGFVSDFAVGADDTPDCVTWLNSAVDDGGHWHVQSDDRDFIGFSITPRSGRALRAAVSRGAVYALVESDAHRHDKGKVSLVTATVPGESERELWIIAHLSEPLATDNSCGVVSGIAIARLVKKMIDEGKIEKPKYTLRLVFSSELYGTSAAADYFGGYLGDRTIGAINIDGMPITYADDKIMTYLAPYSAPSSLNFTAILSMKLLEVSFDKIMTYTRAAWSNYGDDCPLNDSTTALPTVWTHHDRNARNSYHHNSIGSIDFIDPERFRCFTAADAFFVLKSIAPTAEDIACLSEYALVEANLRLSEIAESCKDKNDAKSCVEYHYENMKKHLIAFKKYMSEQDAEALASRLVCPQGLVDREINLTPWQKYAHGVTAKRLTVGLPHDLIAFPKEKRRALPGLALYAPFANVLANLDGKTSLYEIIRRALWETGASESDATYKTYVNTLHYLAEGGYVEIKDENEITRDDIVRTLRSLGIGEGDTVMLHSSLSASGHVVGGAETVIDAFLSVIGEDGTLMAPAFTRPYMYFEGAHQRQRNFRPFSPENIKGISTGAIPKTMLKKYGAKRSAHATHSWCAIGKNAEYCVSTHYLLDPPCSVGNPMEKALGLGGKVVFFGCGVSSNTFIHYLEDGADSNFLENAVIKIVRPDGKHVTEVMPRHLPGCRDFYYFTSPEGCKFYDRAVARGLEIKREPIGAGEVYAMKLSELYEIGTELFRLDPDVTLCDRESCVFCQRYRHKKSK